MGFGLRKLVFKGLGCKVQGLPLRRTPGPQLLDPRAPFLRVVSGYMQARVQGLRG
jgi:hypothetical protein